MLNFFAILLIIFIGILLVVFKKRSFKKLINQSNLNSIKINKNKKSNDKISLHYKSKLISAGRVVRNYRWDRTIR